MDKNKFIEFLIAAKKRGYAAGGEEATSKEADGSHSTRFTEGDFSFHDNYFGGEPFGGREVVFYKQKPYWMMVYYGSNDYDPKILIPFLVKALSNPDKDLPVRGPKILMENDFVYINKWRGNMEKFSGNEIICTKEKPFDETQGKPFDQTPFNNQGKQGKPIRDSQGKPIRDSQGKPIRDSQGKQVYYCLFQGGLVDQKEG